MGEESDDSEIETDEQGSDHDYLEPATFGWTRSKYKAHMAYLEFCKGFTDDYAPKSEEENAMTADDHFARRFASRLAELIRDHGAREFDVRDESGLSSQAFGAIASARREPTLREAMMLARALKVDVGTLAEGLMDYEGGDGECFTD